MTGPMTGPMSTGTYLGLDVGGTKIAALATDADGRVLGERIAPVDGAPLEQRIVTIARQLLDELPDGPPLCAVGVAVPGQVDPALGTLRLAVNLEARDLAIGPLVSAALGAPCFVEHDARAVAAWLHATDEGRRGLAYLSIGTGISAGIVVDGALVRGEDGLAGEIGHLVADPAGPACPCGLRGCLEAVASGPAIAASAAAAMRTGAASDLPAHPTTADVFAAARGGDTLAQRVVSDAAAHIARAVRGLVLAFGVQRVVVGGGVTRAGDAFMQPVLQALDGERMASALVQRAIPRTAVELLASERNAGPLGAVAVARIGLGQLRSDERREVGSR